MEVSNYCECLSYEAMIGKELSLGFCAGACSGVG